MPRTFRIPILALLIPASLGAQGQSPPFVPGGRDIAVVDFSTIPVGGALPAGLTIVSGKAVIAEREGVRMLKANERTILLLTLPSVLPAQFTLEFDIVPRDCICLPADFMFETTQFSNRGDASVEVEWFKDGVFMVGGPPADRDVKAEEGFAESVQGTLVKVGVSVEGARLRLLNNDTELVNQERKMIRSRYLRITLGGNGPEDHNAVYLARVRVATGAPATGVAGQQTGGVAAGNPAGAGSGTGSAVPALTVSATATAQGQASAAWNAVAGAINYFAIRWKPDEPGCCTSMSSPGPSTALTWADGVLPKQGTYRYRVYATIAGGTTYTGETSLTWPPLTVVTTMAPTTATGMVSPAPPPPPPPATVVTTMTPTTATGMVSPAPPPPPLETMPGGPGGRSAPTLASAPNPADQPGAIRVGIGISDITGPVAEVVMMGYAEGSQIANGLHTRLYARAFVFADQADKRVVFVSADLAMAFSSIKQGVIRNLASRFPGRYDDRNVMISATHTHVGPGGYSHHIIYNISTGGHVKETYDAIVAGITDAIVKADASLAPATITLREGNIVERASTNRSLAAFTLNPEAAGAGALPPETPAMTVLGIRRGTQPAGAVSWFAVHNTSLTKGIRQVSSDHKGYASYLMERKYGSVAPLRNYGGFVAAFPNGAEGDLSPNIGPPYGPPTAITFSGPDPNPFVSMKKIGDVEYRTADELYNSVGQVSVTGTVDYRHAFVKMPGLTVASSHTNGLLGKTLCKAAYGVSFMAGTEDGRTGTAEEGLAHGTTMPPGGLEAIRGALVPILMITIPALAPQIFSSFASPEAATDDMCHSPKPVLVPTGRLTNFTPEILPFQILRIGPVAIVGIPGEMTVTGGRRLQRRIMDVLAPTGVQRVILSGLSNEYSGYITTPEEYPSQQYEGASTLFGRLTLDAYIQEFGKLATSLAGGSGAADLAKEAVQAGPEPLDGVQRQLQTGVVFDDVPAGERFGQVLFDAADVNAGDLVKVRFRGAHPKNNLKTNDTYFRVERDAGNGTWELVSWDSTPDSWLFWSRDGIGPAVSYVEIHWDSQGARPGQYRISHSGTYKTSAGTFGNYSGVSRTFQVR